MRSSAAKMIIDIKSSSLYLNSPHPILVIPGYSADWYDENEVRQTWAWHKSLVDVFIVL